MRHGDLSSQAPDLVDKTRYLADAPTDLLISCHGSAVPSLGRHVPLRGRGREHERMSEDGAVMRPSFTVDVATKDGDVPMNPPRRAHAPGEHRLQVLKPTIESRRSARRSAPARPCTRRGPHARS